MGKVYDNVNLADATMDQLLLEVEARKKQQKEKEIEYFMEIINNRYLNGDIDIVKVEIHNPGTLSQYTTYHVHMKRDEDCE